MAAFILFLVGIIFLSIAFQDFKHRMVWVVNYLALTVAYFLAAYFHLVILNKENLLFNVFFLLAITSLTSFYYLLKYREKAFSTLKLSIGWGDILLLPFLVVSFSPSNFVLFLLLSFAISLLWYLGKGRQGPEKMVIPLAGIQAIGMLAAWLASFFRLFRFQVDILSIF